METIVLPKPIPVAEVCDIGQDLIKELLRFDEMRINIYSDAAQHKRLSEVLGLDDLRFVPDVYRVQKELTEHTRNWHVDGGGLGLYGSPDIAVFSNINPTEVLQGELPLFHDWEWENLVENNTVVETALGLEAAEVIVLEPNIYYLLPAPVIHRSPKKITEGMVRLFGRCIIE